jgi:hypothetical protein
MTHHSRTRFPRLAAGVLALATAGLLAGTMAASAGVTPTPGPVTDHHHKLAPEQFDITITNLDPTGDVEAFGPVAAHLGTDQSVSPFRDVLSDSAGDTVKVDHARLPLPTVDLATCSLVFVQFDAPWQFDGGTGIWTGATGSGVFDLTGLVSFREVVKHRQWDWSKPKLVCPLQFVSPGQARWSIEHNGAGLPVPVIFEFGVQAAGNAAVREHKRPEPCPTETINHFAPTGEPSGMPTSDMPACAAG